VSPVVLVLLLVGMDRLLGLERPRLLRPVGRWWRATRPRVKAGIRSAPATYGYAAILFVTTWVLASSRGRLANRLLLAQSTNLHQLARDPVRVLISSAFWLPGTGTLLLWVALLTLVVAPVERRIGSWRTGVVFAVGHVGATLVTAAGLWSALRFDLVERSVVTARDVGPSYGVLGVAGALTYLLAPRLRPGYAALLLLGAAAVAALSHTFTDFGHLLAVLLGLACRRVVRDHPAGPPIDVRLRPLAALALDRRRRAEPPPRASDG
jgi:hypothetical protein